MSIFLLGERKILKVTLAVISSINFYFSNGQNLVPNPGFEDTVSNPIWFIGSFSNKCQLWNDVMPGTADYYYVNSPSYAITTNPRTGNAMAGIFTWSGPMWNNCREILQVELTDSLVAGTTYCVSFYVLLFDTSHYGCNSIGAYFGNSFSTYSCAVIGFPNQIEYTGTAPLDDYTNWTEVSGEFVAAGGETILIISNFKNDADSDTFNINGHSVAEQSYYYIDDVLVTICPEDPLPENSFFVPTAFSPNGDGNNDILFVRGNNVAAIDFHVFDRWGQEVFKSVHQSIGWDGSFNGSQLNSAVFMYYINITYADGKTETVKGNVTLVR